jgi:hypothetical protein
MEKRSGGRERGSGGWQERLLTKAQGARIRPL